MNLAETANLVLLLKLNDQVSSGLKAIQSNVDKTTAKMTPLNAAMYKIGAGIGVGIKNAAKIGIVGLGLLGDQVGRGIDSLAELEDVTTQTRAVIESTGGVAGLTADDIRTMSEAFEDSTTIDDKVIEKGADLLLTFTNVGKEGFQPAMQAALDMSVAMDQDLQTSILQIGKALNDPEKGLGALSRVGVNFDDATKKIIEDMIATGDTAGAQQVIIQELNKEFGGSATAAADTYRGSQAKLQDAVEDLQMALAEALLPAIRKVSDKLREFLKDPDVKEGIRKLGESIAGLFSDDNLKGGGDALKGLFTFLKELPWGQIKDGLSFAAENAKKVVDVFRSLPPGVQAGLLTFLAANKLTGGLVASGLGELAKVALSSLKTITAVNVTVVGANVTGPGGGVPTPGPGAPAAPLGIPPWLAVPLTVATVALTVKGDTPLPVSANALEQQSRDLYGAFQGLDTRIDRDLLGFLRSDADTKTLQAQRAQTAADLLVTWARMGVTAESQVGAATAARLQELAGKATTLNDQTIMIRTNLQTINASTALANARLQTGNSIAETHSQELHDIHWTGIQGLQKDQTANALLADSEDRLSAIQQSSARTAAKDLSVNIDLKTTFQVSARDVANSIRHIDFLQGRGESDY